MPTFPPFKTKPYYESLKSWLFTSHNEDGTLKSSAVQAEVAAAIAAEPTVVQAAADAVDAELASNPNLAAVNSPGTEGEALTVVGGVPDWAPVPSVAAVTALQASADRLETLELDIRRYLVTYPDVDDAIDAMIADIPGASGGAAGVTLNFPFRAGGYAIAREHVIDKPGVRLASDSAYGAIFFAQPSLTGSMFRFQDASYIMRGPQIENIAINMSASSANAITIYGAYDQCSLRNIFITGLNGTASGISILPNPGAWVDVSQTVLAENCWVDGTNGAYSGKTWNLVQLQEAVFISCKGIGGGEVAGSGTGFHVEGCKGLAFYGCSAATVEYGWNIVPSAVQESSAITIDAPTVEGVVTTIRAAGTATHRIRGVEFRNPRRQTATAIDAGPITLDYATLCHLEPGNIPVTIASTCIQTHVYTADASTVTDNGVDSSIIEYRNAANGAMLFGPVIGVRAAAGPEFRYRVNGRTGYFRAYWNASGAGDFGFIEEYHNGSTGIRSRYIDPNVAYQDVMYNNGAPAGETGLRVSNPGTDETAGWLMVNIGGTKTLKRVTVGAADSGGTGYRVLRVAN